MNRLQHQINKSNIYSHIIKHLQSTIKSVQPAFKMKNILYNTRSHLNNNEKLSYFFNPNQSIMTNLLKCSSIQQLDEIYTLNRELFSPYLFSVTCRSLTKIVGHSNQVDNKNIQSLKKFHTFLLDLFNKVKPIQMRQQVTSIQLRNYLYLIKRLMFDNEWMMSCADDQFKNKFQKFKSDVVQCFLDEKRIHLEDYETNAIVEIFYNLTKINTRNQRVYFYNELIERFKPVKITQSNFLSYFYSTNSFLLVIKNIEQSENRVKKQMKLFNDNKNNNINNNNINNNSYNNDKLKQARSKCYQIFLNQWIIYYENFREYLSFQDLIKSLPSIIQSNTGPLLLIQAKYGIRTVDVLQKFLKKNDKNINDLLEKFTNSIGMLSKMMVIFRLIELDAPNNQTLILKKMIKEMQTYLNKRNREDLQKIILRMKITIGGMERQIKSTYSEKDKKNFFIVKKYIQTLEGKKQS